MNLKRLREDYAVYSVVLSTRLRSLSSKSVEEMSPRRNGGRRSVLTTMRLATKCHPDEMAGDELYLRWNGWRRSVPAAKWQATKCEVTKRRRWKGVYPTWGHKLLSSALPKIYTTNKEGCSILALVFSLKPNVLTSSVKRARLYR